jgi:lipid A 4'-phosphatase
MNRAGLVIALGLAVVAGLVFALYPELDLAVARPFYDDAARDFSLRLHPTLAWLRHEAMWVIRVLIAPAMVALVVKLVFPFTRMLMSARAALFLVVTLALGPGLLVNGILKEHWPRSRPLDVSQFGGSERFVPWWDPRGECKENCSFVAGEGAGAFWTLAPAALAPPAWRALAYAAAISFGAAVGALRITFGGHFLSDVVFAGILMFLVIWTVHGAIYRWRATRMSDEGLEGAIARLSWPLYRAVGGLLGRRNKAG